MTLNVVYVDGFENNIDPTSYQSRFNLGSSMSTAVGRKGIGKAYNNAVASSDVSLIPVGVSITEQFVTFGFGLYVDDNSGGMVFSFRDGATDQLQLNVVYSASGVFKLRVRRGATNLETSNETFLDGQWYYIEFAAKIDPSDGFYEVRVDQVPLMEDSGVNTSNNGSTQVTTFRLRAQNDAGNTSFDDVYFAYSSFDSYDIEEPEFYGDLSVEEYIPVSDYDVNWSPNGASTNEECIDQDISDGDTTYNLEETTGYDLFNVVHADQIPHVSKILGLQSSHLSRLEAVGTEFLSSEFYDGFGDETISSSNMTLTRTSYEESWRIFPSLGTPNPLIECQHITNMRLGYEKQ